MNSKNYIFIGIAVIIIVFLGYFLVAGQQTKQDLSATNVDQEITNQFEVPSEQEENLPEEESSEESSDDEGLIIEYTDSGFSPKTITVEEGEAVTWVNQSTKGMWVASAPHPAHTDYPGFDQKESGSRGEKYTFNFDQIGTWKYHNHVNPADTGTIVVEED